MIHHDVEQGTDEWFALRAGIPTASEFSKLISGTGQRSKSLPDYARTLAAEKFAGKPLDRWEGNQWTERGHEIEDEARAWYELNYEPVDLVGFCTNDLMQYGASPDGITKSGVGLEIKCKIAKEHVKALEYCRKHKRPPPEYIPQCQGVMMVCELEYLDILFYHPDLPPQIVRVAPDPGFVMTLREQLQIVEAERNLIINETLKEDDCVRIDAY